MTVLNTAIKEQISYDLAAGVSQHKIAAQHGIDQSTVSRFNTSIKPLILAQQERKILTSLKTSVDNDILTLNLANELTNLVVKCDSNVKYKKLKSLSHKMAMVGINGKDILVLGDKKGARLHNESGIGATPTASPTVNTWHIGDITIHSTIEPGVKAALGGHLAGILSDNNVTDADYTEDMRNIEGED